jgi:transketolase
MRGAFIQKLLELAERDPRILLLTGDLGYLALEPFAEKFPKRFFNVGVAEQNMVGLATGLAEAGFIPFVYSIVPFAVLRPYEFIRNGPVAHRLPVRIVGVGGGFEYGPNGFTHYGLEDIAVMRTQPGISIIAPADPLQTRTALEETWSLPGPVYYRLGKDDRTVVPGLEGAFQLGKLQRLKSGGKALLVAMGSVAVEVVKAGEDLERRGIHNSVAVLASVSPPPVDDLVHELARHELVLAVEAHYQNGGLGSLLAEVIAERGLECRLVRCAVKELPCGATGSQAWLHHKHALSAPELVRVALQAMHNPPGPVKHPRTYE